MIALERSVPVMRMIGNRFWELVSVVVPPVVGIDTLRAISRAFPGYPLRIDPNGGWSVATTRRLMPQFEGLLEYLEDPVNSLDEAGEVATRAQPGIARQAETLRGERNASRLTALELLFFLRRVVPEMPPHHIRHAAGVELGSLARSRTASAHICSGFMDRAPPTADAADASPPPPLANTADVFIEDADADADDDTLSCDAEKVKSCVPVWATWSFWYRLAAVVTGGKEERSEADDSIRADDDKDGAGAATGCVAACCRGGDAIQTTWR
jgi:hypothetical protein